MLTNTYLGAGGQGVLLRTLNALRKDGVNIANKRQIINGRARSHVGGPKITMSRPDG